MHGIGDFFSRIRNVYAKEIFVRQAVLSAIKMHTGADIATDSIKFKNGTVVLGNINPALRSVIFIKKQHILKEIASKQQLRAISDIR